MATTTMLSTRVMPWQCCRNGVERFILQMVAMFGNNYAICDYNAANRIYY